MKEIIKASADWYFDGPGWIIMTFLGVALANRCYHRPKFWAPVSVLLLLVIPGIFIWARHF